jgi:hypothetical protein
LEVASGFPARPLDFSMLKLRRDGTDHTGRHLILKIKQVLDAPSKRSAWMRGLVASSMPGNSQAIASPANAPAIYRFLRPADGLLDAPL